jgi:Ca2+-binding RTX toxin-like protein
MNSINGTDIAETIKGTQGDDLIKSLNGDDVILPSSGNDTIFAGDGNDRVLIDDTSSNTGLKLIYGESGNDFIEGGNRNDTLYGGIGNDSIFGLEGNDSLIGGSGNDRLDDSSGNDTIEGGEGDDLITARLGDDYIDGGSGKDEIYGAEGNDTIYGGDGSDSISCGFGSDRAEAGFGDDFVNGGEGNDWIDGGDGNDNLSGAIGNDTIYGGAGRDTISGGNDNDSILGGADQDTISGNAGDDYIDGGSENDTLYGGAGNDTIDGGDGNNFIYGDEGVDTVAYPKEKTRYEVKIDGPAVIVIDSLTRDKNILFDIEKISFANNSINVSEYGKTSVDFNSLGVDEKKKIIEDYYSTIFFPGNLKWAQQSLSYSFAQTPTTDRAFSLPVGETFKFEVLGSYLQNVARQTFNYISQIVNLSFTESSNTQGSSFRFYAHNMTAGGYAVPPGNTESGIVAISSKTNGNLLGGYGVSTVIHELCHALGLEHTSPRGSVSAGEGGGDTAPSLPDYLDRSSLSMMSYAKTTIESDYSASLSALDLRALISLYGKRNSNDSTIFNIFYDPFLPESDKGKSLNTVSTNNWTIYGYAPFMLADNGGIDTVDVSNWKGGVRVDLSGWGIGTIDGSRQAYRFNSDSNEDLIKNSEGSPIITIYPDTIIEKIIGSPLSDILTGHTADETISAGGGDDSISGADGTDILNGESGNDILTGGSGNDVINGGDGQDTANFTRSAKDFILTVGSKQITIKDKIGSEGTDVLTGIEYLSFTDKKIPVQTKAHGSYADLPDTLYQFFIVAFGGAPGVTYMDQMAEAYRYWLPEFKGETVRQIVEAFTNKQQFTSLYPQALYRESGGKYFLHSHDITKPGNHLVKQSEVTKATFDNQMKILATALVDKVIKTSASATTKASAISDVQGALSLGGEWTIGKVIYTIFGNLAGKSTFDAVWGGTAKQFSNQVAVSKYYTDILSQSTDDVATLRSVIEAVNNSTDVSSPDAIATLIGISLLNGPGG